MKSPKKKGSRSQIKRSKRKSRPAPATVTSRSPTHPCADKAERPAQPHVEAVQARIPTNSSEAVQDLDALALEITSNAKNAVLALEHLRCFVSRVEPLEKSAEENVRYVQ